MSILKIARMGHPILSTPVEPVEDPSHRDILRLVKDMIETMIDAHGTGLAAPQVHVAKRVVIFQVYPKGAHEHADDSEGVVPLTVLINPEITPLSDDKESGWEGCLSIPAMMGKVERFTRIRYAAYDLNGQRFECEASGFHARVVQHECDHLDGMLYPQRIVDMRQFGFTEELARRIEAED